MGFREFWQDLEISKAFLRSLEVSFLHGLFLIYFFESLKLFAKESLGLGFLTKIPASSGKGFVHFHRRETGYF